MVVVIFLTSWKRLSRISRGTFSGFPIYICSAGSLSNIIAGLILTYMRLFKIGDRVKIGDVVGDVIENHYW
jgi:small-conductance mechanosensitive channel